MLLRKDLLNILEESSYLSYWIMRSVFGQLFYPACFENSLEKFATQTPNKQVSKVCMILQMGHVIPEIYYQWNFNYLLRTQLSQKYQTKLLISQLLHYFDLVQLLGYSEQSSLEKFASVESIQIVFILVPPLPLEHCADPLSTL